MELITAQGLNSKQVKELQSRYGLNKVEYKHDSILKLVLKQFLNPLVYLLLVAAVISFILNQNVDGTVILIIIFINSGLGLLQEKRSDSAFKKLSAFLTEDVTVIRQGRQTIVDKEQLVPGDIVILSLGDIVPADCVILASKNLLVDESALTGESTAIGKYAGKATKKRNPKTSSILVPMSSMAMLLLR